MRAISGHKTSKWGIVISLALALGVLNPGPATAATPTPVASDGFGLRATGGAGGEEYWVTTLADSGPGSLRDGAERPGRRWIRFAVSGDLVLSRRIMVASDKTIDGRDARVTLRNKGLNLVSVCNVIVTDLRFEGITGPYDDAVGISDGTCDVLVTHSEFAGGEDGMVDITRGATNVTVSWNRFTNHVKVMLINSRQANGSPAQVTVHHNVFDGTSQRHPLVLEARVHAYNNHLRDFEVHGMRADVRSEIRSEANVLESRRSPRAVVSKGSPAGRVLSSGDLLLSGAQVTQYEAAQVFNPASVYRASIDPATSALVARLAAEAGRRVR